MAIKMAQTKITINTSGSQVLHSNPAIHPLPPNAGIPVAAAVKTAGNPNGNAQGQVASTSIVFSNPA